MAYFSVFYQRAEHADATFTRLENKVWFENSAENTRLRLVFSPKLLSCSTTSCVLYTTEQSTVEAYIFVDYTMLNNIL